MAFGGEPVPSVNIFHGRVASEGIGGNERLDRLPAEFTLLNSPLRWKAMCRTPFRQPDIVFRVSSTWSKADARYEN
jgi:hypothetical protein